MQIPYNVKRCTYGTDPTAYAPTYYPPMLEKVYMSPTTQSKTTSSPRNKKLQNQSTTRRKWEDIYRADLPVCVNRPFLVSSPHWASASHTQVS